MIRSILFSVIVLLFVTSCDFDCLEGHGDVKTQARTVKPFKKISLGIDAKVILVKDSVQSVRIEAQSNLLDAIDTEVSGDCLNIESEGCFSTNHQIIVYVSLPELTGVEIGGSGDIEGKSNFPVEDLDLQINGSGKISLEVSAKSIDATINGSGDIFLSGSTRDFKGEVAGSGNINADKMPADKSKVEIHGSGNAYVFAIRKLDIDVAGSGNVYYKGSPDISSNISGSGKLEKSH